jgi:cation:H+ antiporter
MTPIAVPVIVFAAGTLLILLAGSRLPVVGQAVGRRFGIGATALGLFALAAITSLPELAVTLTAMLRQRLPDLALANVLGSNNFNLAVIAGLQLAVGGGVILSRVDAARYTRTALLVVGFTAVTGAGAVFAGHLPRWLPVLLFSVPIITVFFWELVGGGRGIPLDEEAEALRDAAPERAACIVPFVALAAVVVAGSVAVSWAAKAIAEYRIPLGAREISLGATFVGTLFLAVATSLPEVTVAFSAIRRVKSPDMAVGTLLGSNAFNILVFAVLAPFLAVGHGPHSTGWAELAPLNIVNVAVGIVLTLLVLAAMRARQQGTALVLTGVLIPVYLVGVYLVFAGGVR